MLPQRADDDVVADRNFTAGHLSSSGRGVSPHTCYFTKSMSR